jgi:hypothetical protein
VQQAIAYSRSNHPGAGSQSSARARSHWGTNSTGIDSHCAPIIVQWTTIFGRQGKSTAVGWVHVVGGI